MSLEYRAPRAVREESTDNDSDIAQRIAEPMSFEDVLEIRSSWKGIAGIEWANKITQDIAERADFIARFEERANAARIGEGTYVSWPNSDGSRNQGKVEKVTTRGPVTSTQDYTIEATPDFPVFSIRVYKKQGNGFNPTESVVYA